MKNIIKIVLLSMAVAFATPYVQAMDFDLDSFLSDFPHSTQKISLSDLLQSNQTISPLSNSFENQDQNDSFNPTLHSYDELDSVISDSETKHSAKKKKTNGSDTTSTLSPDATSGFGHIHLDSYSDSEHLSDMEITKNKNFTPPIPSIVVPQMTTITHAQQQKSFVALAKVTVAKSPQDIPKASSLEKSKSSQSRKRKRKEYICQWEDCEESFENENVFFEHTNAHASSSQDYICRWKTCKRQGKVFTAKGNLKRHIMRTHTGEKPFKCKQCNYAAAISRDLTGHIMRKHTGEKPYKCDQCNYASAVSTNLKRHIMYRHTREKPFKCKQCNYAAVISRDLTRHKETHKYKSRRRKCDYCKCWFGQKNTKKYLDEHMAKHHPDKIKKRSQPSDIGTFPVNLLQQFSQQTAVQQQSTISAISMPFAITTQSTQQNYYYTVSTYLIPNQTSQVYLNSKLRNAHAIIAQPSIHPQQSLQNLYSLQHGWFL